MSSKALTNTLDLVSEKPARVGNFWKRFETYLDAIRAGREAQAQYEAHVRANVSPAEAAARAMERSY